MTRESQKKDKRRYAFLVGVCVAVFVLFAFALFSVQIIHGEEYSAARDALSVSNVTVEGARGQILDTNGNPLVTNRQGNSIIFDGSYFPSATKQSERNEIIISLVKLLEKNKLKWINALPIKFDSTMKPVFIDGMENDISYLKSKDYLYLNDYASAQNCFDALVKRYEVEEYSKADQLKIIAVCYNMKKLLFTTDNPYVFAEDVPEEIIAYIKENSDFYRGVDVQIVTYREYVEGSLAPHILGYVDSITAEQYEYHKNDLEERLSETGLTPDRISEIKSVYGYGLNDKIGQFGIESAMEEYLRGKDGVRTTIEDANGNKKTEYSKNPTQGDTVILTIDTTLQRIAQEALAERISKLPYNENLPAAGAVVAVDVNNGAVLACATYPSFDLSTYKKDYSKLASDEASPLWNRALQNTYAPGSTFKPAIACAGLEEGVITRTSKFTCNGTFNKFSDQTFKCLGVHGNIDVREALNQSCNIFFFETGLALGINKMNTYCKLFGFGEKTGVELGEASGVLASIEYKSSLGQTWYPGDTVQAAIGQSDNLFTPVQLASYCATIANGGTRYQAHFVKSVKSYDFTKTVIDNNANPTVLNETGIKKETFDTVKEGMRRVGARNYALKTCPVNVAAKTGTAEISKLVDGKKVSGTNGLLISFAPYENPQIAIAIVVENAETGSSTAQIAADIYTAYFSSVGEADMVESYNTPLR
ncbi:MAG: hypothetical protein K5755_04915 [Clostridiales bacterium]|nr:hypothetical protein [Clostridiales bacterium]